MIPSGGQWYICGGETALCQIRESGAWDGRDQIVVC